MNAKRIVTIFVIGFIVLSCTGRRYPTAEIVATTAWTAAYALAAGAESVTTLTPFEMIHPSEYELRPGDLKRLAEAQLVIYAGYETMMAQLKGGLQIRDEKLLPVITSYNFDEIEKSVMLIAARLGTQEIARRNLSEIKSSLIELRKAVQESGIDTENAVVHFFQQSFMANTGIETSGVFGPAPPGPREIFELTNSGASMIIDNIHNPSGEALRRTMKDARYVKLLNFPGLYGTRTIEDVIRHNTRQILSR